MAELVNLRTARKRKKQAEKERLAEENRIRFGRTKVEKQKSTATGRLLKKHLDAHKRSE